MTSPGVGTDLLLKDQSRQSSGFDVRDGLQ